MYQWVSDESLVCFKLKINSYLPFSDMVTKIQTFINHPHQPLQCNWYNNNKNSSYNDVPSCKLMDNGCDIVVYRRPQIRFRTRGCNLTGNDTDTKHAIDLLWEKFQWILPLYMKPISFQSKASIVCSVTEAIIIDFCLKKLNAFSHDIGKKKMDIWIPQNKSPGIEMMINFLC